MFHQVRVLGWVLEIDRDATIAAHKNLPEVWPLKCTCLNCQNFIAAKDFLPQEFIQLCSSLGATPIKATEVYEMGSGKEKGTRYYGGWYHVVGRIISMADSEQAPEPATKSCGAFQISFTERADLIPKDFPLPVLQLNFYGDMPWILDEQPDKIG